MNQTDNALDEITKALEGVNVANADVTSANSGANNIDLRAASHIVTLATPFTDLVPRDQDGTGLAFLYNVIKGTATGDTSGYTEEGKRGAQINFSGAQSGAYYKTIAVEMSVTDEAWYGANGQRDLRADAVNRAFLEAKRIQEKIMLFGRATTASDSFAAGALGTTGTVTAAGVSTGGSIGAATYSVIAVALNGYAYDRLKSAVPGKFTGSTFANFSTFGVLPYSRTNADGTTTAISGGCAIKSSAASTGALSGSTNVINASVVPTLGAIGYAWFVGVSGSEIFQGVTATSNISLTSLVTGSQAAAGTFTSDNSAEAFAYDGILTRLLKSGSGAYLNALANGTALTADGDGGLSALSDIFSNMAAALDGYSPEYAMISPATQKKINAALLTSGTGHPQFFLQQSAESAGDLEAGRRVSVIYNPVMGRKVKLIVNPYMPESTILLGTTQIPSLMAENGSAPVIFSARRDYMAEIWPRTSRKQQNTVTIDGALGLRWADGFGVVTNFV